MEKSTDLFTLSIAALALCFSFLAASGILGVGLLAVYRFKHHNKGAAHEESVHS